MRIEQHERDEYRQELARIGRHQNEAVQAQSLVFQALAAVGIGHEKTDAVVAQLEAGAVAGAHAWISESCPPASAEQGFQDGWFAGVRDVAGYLLRIADTTATTGALRPMPCWSPTSSRPPPPPRRRLPSRPRAAVTDAGRPARVDPGEPLLRIGHTVRMSGWFAA